MQTAQPSAHGTDITKSQSFVAKENISDVNTLNTKQVPLKRAAEKALSQPRLTKKPRTSEQPHSACELCKTKDNKIKVLQRLLKEQSILISKVADLVKENEELRSEVNELKEDNLVASVLYDAAKKELMEMRGEDQ